jgi:hypothetical protein
VSKDKAGFVKSREELLILERVQEDVRSVCVKEEEETYRKKPFYVSSL